MVSKYSVHLPNTRGGYMLRTMAAGLGTIPIADYEQAQSELEKKRQVRRAQEIAVLKEMRTDLQKNNRNKAKKPASVKKRTSVQK